MVNVNSLSLVLLVLGMYLYETSAKSVELFFFHVIEGFLSLELLVIVISPYLTEP